MASSREGIAATARPHEHGTPSRLGLLKPRPCGDAKTELSMACRLISLSREQRTWGARAVGLLESPLGESVLHAAVERLARLDERTERTDGNRLRFSSQLQDLVPTIIVHIHTAIVPEKKKKRIQTPVVHFLSCHL